MSIVEHEVIGDVFLMTLISFFGLALPGYALVRKYWPESDWNHGGNVSTSVIQPLDLVIAGGYLMLFFYTWAGLLDKAVVPPTPTVSLMVLNMVAKILMTSVIPAVLYWRVDLREFFGLRWERWRSALWIGPAFVLAMMMFGGMLIQAGWKGWVEKNFESDIQGVVALLKESNDVGLLIALAISAVIIAPITEEIIFRGYLYPVVKRYTDRWFAAVFTGVLFGVIHFNLFSLPALAVMGVVLVILYEITGSLWVTIACHAAFNATSVGALLIPKIAESVSGS